MVWGMKGSELVLKSKGSNDQLIFKDLLPTFHNQKSMKMTLRSHPGKGVCLTNKNRQHGHGMEEFLTLGDSHNAISIFADNNHHIHLKHGSFQTLDGYDHTKRDLEFFTMHLEYKH